MQSNQTRENRNSNTPEQASKLKRSSAVHQHFDWLADDAKDYPMADFVALTMDVSNGIHSCLQIVHVSNLERSRQASELDPDDVALPAVDENDSEKLLRLAMATARLLREFAEQKVDWINAFGPAHLEAMKKGRAK